MNALLEPKTELQSQATGLLFLALVGLLLTRSVTSLAQEEAVEVTNATAAEPAEEQVKEPAEVTPPIATVQARERVSVGGGLKVRADETVREAVSVFGSSDVAGTVTREMVTVFGRAKMTGSVEREMVTVFGDAVVDGPVGRECVTVFGNLKLGPNAKLGRDCVAVFGRVQRDPGAQLEQEPVEVLPMLSGLGDWITDGLLLGRLIPPSSKLAWIVVGLHLLLYGLIALLLPRPVKSCVTQLETKPLLSFGVGLLTIILLTPLYVILAAIGVGVVLIPFIGLAETAFVCVGKTASFEFFGLQILRGFGRKPVEAPLGGFLLGFFLVTLLYMVPIVGLLLWMILRPVALGAAVLSCTAAMKKNGTVRTPDIPVTQVTPTSHLTTPPVMNNPSSSAAAPAAESPAQPRPTPPPPTASSLAMVVMPRAGFWIRLVASALDFIALCWILMLPHVDSYFLFFWIAYHIGMWSWRGTTIGGIVCNLKVVRLDGRDPDFSVCLVRGLACIFSALPLFLGFFWTGWTSERQSWHDKIAGTVIVRVPKGLSLL